mgnify:CR=1 FL=1
MNYSPGVLLSLELNSIHILKIRGLLRLLF